ncbi:MAG: asparagine synthase (glutamine-hydrolyzing) [Corynebacteriales bacterium]|nr:asparagine synthase (glutamine-hydrolyzing) [Mycobacteriales bacterium]
MCGIAGYTGISTENGHAVLRRMARVQAHRGPDGEGFFTHERIGLAHRRLSIIDRAGGEQPMRSVDDRYVISYNGEVYNYRELRAELIELGHTFRTASDTEVVLNAWLQWGTAAFDRFNGMFGLAIADTRTGEIILARDQFGIKPVYLAEDGAGTVVFASELRPIIAAGIIPRRPDDVTLFRYLRFRVHDDTERTFFAGITRLMPGQMATISADGTVRRETYTTLYEDLEKLAANPKPYDNGARERIAAALHKAIHARLVAEVPVGTALSGGLDSSTVVAMVNKLIGEHDPDVASVGSRQQSFSAVFPGERNDEERYVNELAMGLTEHLQVHKVHPQVDSFQADMRDFIRTQEEPIISTGPYAQYCVMREATKHVTVMLDGQGADEMMAGYSPYFLVYLRQLKRRKKLGRLTVESLRASDVMWRLGRFLLADKLLRRSNTPPTDLLEPEFVQAHKGERFDVIGNDLKPRLVHDIFRHSLPSLLRYEDRNTMRFSLEGRVPFLDMDLLKELWALDEKAILHASWNKRALRDATRELLPPMINRRRNKIGFTTPEDAWFVHIKDYLQDVFSSPEFGSRPYFNQEAVMKVWTDFVNGRGGAETMTFWRLLNVELWMREFIDVDPTTWALPASEQEPVVAAAESLV